MNKSKQFCPQGHNTYLTGRYKNRVCKVCLIEKSRLKTKNQSEVISSKKREYYNKNKEKQQLKSRVYSYLHKKEKTEYNKKYQKENREKINFYVRSHPEIYRLSNLKNQTNRNLRIPKFGQESIKEFYKNCPKGMVVDHIIPLQNSKVSGLHVAWNLQYLTPEENRFKKNKFDGTLYNTAWKLYD